MDAAVVPIRNTPRVFGEDEALAWLRDNGPVQLSNAALARAWGWNATKVSRRLKAWQSAGLIERTRQGITAAAPPVAVPASVTAATPEPEPDPVPEPAAAPSRQLPAVLPAALPATHLAADAQPALPPAAVLAILAAAAQESSRESSRELSRESSQAASQEPSREPPRVRKPTLPAFVVRCVSPLLGAAALALGAIGVVLNARFAASFGQTDDAAWILAGIGIVIDLIAILLPVAAGQLWRQRCYLSAVGAWAVWVVAIMMTLLAASGFAATHIGDAVSGRSKISDEAAGLTQTLQRLRAERAQIAERRAIETIDAELQAAQPAAGPVWRITSGCTDVTRPESAKLCEQVQRLRQARGEAVRRDAIDRDTKAVEQRLAVLPAVTVGDPGAAMVTELVTWLSRGAVQIVQRDVERARILGLMILPSLAGLLLGFATLMRAERPRRQENLSARESSQASNEIASAQPLSATPL